MRRKGSGKSFKRKTGPWTGRGKGGYDLEAAFSCQPNEDGMNSWSWCFSVRKSEELPSDRFHAS